MKESLIIDLKTVEEYHLEQYGVKAGTRLITYDFVLVSDADSKELRERNALEATKALGGLKMKLWNGLPVPDVD